LPLTYEQRQEIRAARSAALRQAAGMLNGQVAFSQLCYDAAGGDPEKALWIALDNLDLRYELANFTPK
jgi:hypothetical protein